MKRTLMPVLAIGAVALVAAGCGSSKKSSSSTTAAAPAAAATTTQSSSAAAKGETIAVKKSKVGGILVDEEGHVLYLFEADKGPQSTCSGACAKAWPPVTTSGAPVAERGALASKLGTTKRSDGKSQVTYGGHPLYYYAEDTKPGQMKGQGSKQFGAEWYVVGPAGKKVEGGEHKAGAS
jgi:predicted lipoprotein with Yx(FWY)xxD motif